MPTGNIKVAFIPGRSTEVVVNTATSVADVLELAGEEFSNIDGFQIQVDGVPATKTAVVHPGSSIHLVRNVKGNQQFIKIAYIPGAVKEIAVEDGARPTVADIAESAEFSLRGYQVQVNGVPRSVDSVVQDGDSIHLVKNVKGNNH